jgi:hypothetical protein
LAIWYIFSSFGILYQEKSGNPAQANFFMGAPALASPANIPFSNVPGHFVAFDAFQTENFISAKKKSKKSSRQDETDVCQGTFISNKNLTTRPYRVTRLGEFSPFG